MPGAILRSTDFVRHHVEAAVHDTWQAAGAHQDQQGADMWQSHKLGVQHCAEAVRLVQRL